MAIAKRVLLFTIVNTLIITTLFFVWNLVAPSLGIEPGSYYGIIIIYSIFGMGGAFVSLWTSKWMAKRMMGVQIIDPNTSDPKLRELVTMVHNMSRAARLPKMPEVGIYEGVEVNAFATGPSKSNSLVAVSTGLLNRMNKDQVEGVIGHEVAHISNGDMVTMTLIQGIINTMVLLAARFIAQIVASNLSNSDEEGQGGSYMVTYFAVSMVLQIVLSILGSVVVNYFSRHREFRADNGGAKYAGRDKMISALKALAGTEDYVNKEDEAFASLKISGRSKSALALLFSTHPPLEQRIAALEGR